ncbi:MAG TPA: bifunctional nuclease family protein [Nitrospira sp.]|nr:bifunctional nuclease family protein [Nitrospira sp.]
MSKANPVPDHGLIEYKVDRVVDETNTDTKIVVLARQDGQPDSFPIWVGASEGHAIKLALDTTLTPRPMSHDLIKGFIEHLNVSVRRVVIADVKNSTYYATVYLENHGVERTVDARPSDAISLALRTHAPVYITQDVLSRRNTANIDSWLAKLDNKTGNQQELRES